MCKSRLFRLDRPRILDCGGNNNTVIEKKYILNDVVEAQFVVKRPLN